MKMRARGDSAVPAGGRGVHGFMHQENSDAEFAGWEGYADPAFVKAFEEQHHCKVSASYMGSSDELVAKLRGGSAGNYDVISPSSDVATSIAAAGLAAPLDLTKIPSYRQLSPQLTSLPLVRMNSQVYGVPFMWGPDPLL